LEPKEEGTVGKEGFSQGNKPREEKMGTQGEKRESNRKKSKGMGLAAGKDFFGRKGRPYFGKGKEEGETSAEGTKGVVIGARRGSN